jgi:phage FluMu gp28-like protein
MRVHTEKMRGVISYYIEKAFRNYQKRWLSNKAPFVANTGPRQVGKDYTYSGGCSIDCIAQPETIWNIVSATRIQAAQFIGDAKRHCEAILAALAAELPNSAVPKAEYKNAEIVFSNGSILKMLSATPQSIVGNRGNFLFNEVGINVNAEEVYETAFPIVTGARDNGKNARFIMVSNATKRGRFYEQFINGARSKYFHKIIGTWRGYFSEWLSGDLNWAAFDVERWLNKRETIYKSSIGARAFGQWFNCLFTDSSGNFFSEDLLDSISVDTFDYLENISKAQQIIGMDIGRKVHPTVIQPLIQFADKWVQSKHLRSVLRGARYEAQLLELERIADARQTIAIVADKTGIGDALVEQIESVYPAITEGFAFTESSKWALVSNAKSFMESRNLLLDSSDLDLRMELDSIEVSENGHKSTVIFPENKTNPENITHCDNASALFLGAWGARGLRDTTPLAYDAPRAGRGAALADAQPKGAIMGAWQGFNLKQGW